MSKTVYLADSYPWLTRQLLTSDLPDPTIAVMVDSRTEADLIVFPKTDRKEDGAGDRLRDFSLGELRRTCVYSQLDEPFPWAPGMYASLPVGYAKRGFVGGFYVVQHHVEAGGIGEDLEAARTIEPDVLWSFAGTVSNHPVRSHLLGLQDDRAIVRDTQRWSDEIRWKWKKERRVEAREAFSGYADLLGRSQFVVCPRGRGAGSIRLFEALRVGRPPVIVSDDWLPPPFVDWESCSIDVPEAEVGRLPELLREREPEARVLGARARTVWEESFAPQKQLSTLVAGSLLAAETAPGRLGLALRATMRRQSVWRGLRRVKGALR